VDLPFFPTVGEAAAACDYVLHSQKPGTDSAAAHENMVVILNLYEVGRVVYLTWLSESAVNCQPANREEM
jgi:hypothetical protein